MKMHIFIIHEIKTGLPRWLSGKESSCQRRRHRFDPWVRKIPRRKKWHPFHDSCLKNLGGGEGSVQHRGDIGMLMADSHSVQFSRSVVSNSLQPHGL